MAVTIELHEKSSVPIEVEGIVPDTCQEISLAEIEKQEVFHGNRKLPLAELFSVSGDPTDGQIHWR